MAGKITPNAVDMGNEFEAMSSIGNTPFLHSLDEMTIPLQPGQGADV